MWSCFRTIILLHKYSPHVEIWKEFRIETLDFVINICKYGLRENFGKGSPEFGVKMRIS